YRAGFGRGTLRWPQRAGCGWRRVATPAPRYPDHLSRPVWLARPAHDGGANRLRTDDGPWERGPEGTPASGVRSDARGRTGRFRAAALSARIQRRPAAANRDRPGAGLAAAVHRRRRAGFSPRCQCWLADREP